MSEIASREQIAKIRRRHAALAGREWEAMPHQHPASGCRCVSCYDDPTGWLVDHPSTLDCEERVAKTPNDFRRERGSCSLGPLLTFDEADALAHAADDIAYLLDQLADRSTP